MSNGALIGRDLAILAGRHPWTWALARALRQRFGDVPIILEAPPSQFLLMRHRIRRLGVLHVAGQLGFGLMAKALRPLHWGQQQKILAREGLDPTPISDSVIAVSSVNDDRTIEVLRALQPKVVIVSQTRILARRTLASIPAAFINVHTGIMPYYRGHHGAYWALAKGDLENCGVTVHVVDAGVDTGAIIAQARIRPCRSDSYFTYHWLQLAAALPLLMQAVEDALAGRLAAHSPDPGIDSPQYYHPTIWAYLWFGLRRGVW